MNSYFVGSTIRLSVTFLVAATQAAYDPGTVAFDILRPGPQRLSPDAIRDSSGHYHVDLVVDTPGVWKVRVSSTNPASADESAFEVRESSFA